MLILLAVVVILCMYCEEQPACRVVEIRRGCICKCSCWNIQSSHKMHLVSVY